MPTANPKGTESHGPFANHVGVDGTTIWASATSGKGVVTMHLLACMLARMWKGPEAISIWSELVDYRRAFLARHVEESITFHASDMAASRIKISRDQLAEWDASARAWIKSADKAKELQQTQLRLVLKNLSLPVSKKTDLYPAVIETWKVAMKAADEVVLGRPLRIASGDVILGLSSWHLYPDIRVVRGKGYHVKQDDPLVAIGGVITVGLEDRPDKAGDGVYWSLPLAHYQYYGASKLATRASGLKESQVTYEQFRFIILGGVLSGWGTKHPDMESVSRLLDRLAEALENEPSAGVGDNRPHWLSSLAQCARELRHSTHDEHKKQRSLVAFGRRRFREFLSPKSECPPPVFGLADIGSMALNEAVNSKVSDQVAFLRAWAVMKLDPQKYASLIIRYRIWSYDSKGNHLPFGEKPNFLGYTNVFSRAGVPRTREKLMDTPQIPDSADDFIQWYGEGYTHAGQYHEEKYTHAGHIQREVYPPIDTRWFFPSGPDEPTIGYNFVCGNPNSVAVFMPAANNKEVKQQTLYQASVEDLLQGMESGLFSVAGLLSVLSASYELHEQYFTSLQALSKVEQIYRQLPGAVVDLQITSRPAFSRRWKKLMCKFPEHRSDRLVTALTCIAMFETGFVEIDPSKMEGVIALAYEDSLYVASYLLPEQDAKFQDAPVRRVTGNVGKPGLTLIITPAEPKIRQTDYSSWQVVQHVPCQGTPVDHFASTSLHLSFTGYELPLDIGARGTRDAEVSFSEAVISVHEGGKWVADLDVDRAYRDGLDAGMSSCVHSVDARSVFPHHMDLLSIENWTEFLDPPVQGCVFMAAGNFAATLAARALCLQKRFPFRLVSSEGCWPCALALRGRRSRASPIKPPIKPPIKRAPWASSMNDEIIVEQSLEQPFPPPLPTGARIHQMLDELSADLQPEAFYDPLTGQRVSQTASLSPHGGQLENNGSKEPQTVIYIW